MRPDYELSSDYDYDRTSEKIEKAKKDLRDGKPVLIYDFGDREGETDIVYAAEKVDHESIARLRNDAGGLICVPIHPEAADSLGLPFLSDALEGHPAVEDAGDLEYDTRSSFSLWVNHRSNYTGITDKDRAATARALAEAVRIGLPNSSESSDASDASDERDFEFADEFRTPGHTAVLRAAENLLEDRQGQTEMSVELVQEAGLVPAAVLAEMLDDTTGEALSKHDARKYAEENALVFLEGEELVEYSKRKRSVNV